jgi:peptidoglycan biosynthesis protein MviN/MurJ (putative lipid II flippase)
MLVIKLILSALFVRPLAHEGLALATVCAAVVGFLIMTVDIGKKLKSEFRAEMAPFMAKSLAVLTIVALMWIGLKLLWPSTQFDSLSLLFLKLSLFALIGIGLLLILGKLFKQPESQKAIELMTAKFKRGR